MRKITLIAIANLAIFIIVIIISRILSFNGYFVSSMLVDKVLSFDYAPNMVIESILIFIGLTSFTLGAAFAMMAIKYNFSQKHKRKINIILSVIVSIYLILLITLLTYIILFYALLKGNAVRYISAPAPTIIIYPTSSNSVSNQTASACQEFTLTDAKHVFKDDFVTFSPLGTDNINQNDSEMSVCGYLSFNLDTIDIAISYFKDSTTAINSFNEMYNIDKAQNLDYKIVSGLNANMAYSIPGKLNILKNNEVIEIFVVLQQPDPTYEKNLEVKTANAILSKY